MRGMKGDFLAVSEPSVRILDVPALRCDTCGASRIADDVLGRLSIIVERAVRYAERRGLVAVSWAFTSHGPPEIGGLPRDVRDSFAKLRGLIVEERLKMEALERLGHETPRWFH